MKNKLPKRSLCVIDGNQYAVGNMVESMRIKLKSFNHITHEMIIMK